jgi:uncharacterized protein involved in exopolysaccharide biosynthesis
MTSGTDNPKGLQLAPVPPQSTESGPAMSALAFANVILRYRRPIVLLAVVFAIVAFYESITSGRTYTATGSFTPAGQQQAANVSGLAAQIGFATGDVSQSPGFYSELIPSRVIMQVVADSPLIVTKDGKTRQMTTAQWFGIGDVRNPINREALLGILRGSIALATSPASGIMRISATSADPEVSRQLAKHTIDAIVEFNLRRRRERMESEKEFVDLLLNEYFQKLQAAAERFQQFQMENREYKTSPKLAFEAERLQADVQWKQDLYTSIAHNEEQLRVDAMRNSPSVSVFEQPVAPVAPNARGTIGKTISAFVLGLLLGVFLAFVIEFIARSGVAHPSALEEFQALRDEAIKDLRLKRLRRG